MDLSFLFIIVVLILSVIIHEMAHGYAAEALGDPTARIAGRLTLNPIAHIDPIGSVLVPLVLYVTGGFIFGWAKPVPYNPYNIEHKWGDALVAGAGPLSNIAIALLFALLVHLDPFVAFLGASGLQLVTAIIYINIILALFNLIPIPPLDGSKILFNALPFRYRHIREWLERYSLFLVVVAAFVIWPIVAPLVNFITAFLIGR